jgi:ribosomal protein L29
MALLRSSEVKKMSQKDRDEKLKELRFSLMRSQVTANKSSGKAKEIKRAIARILTFSNANTVKSPAKTHKAKSSDSTSGEVKTK